MDEAYRGTTHPRQRLATATIAARAISMHKSDVLARANSYVKKPANYVARSVFLMPLRKRPAQEKKNE
jgi:hypothetical protein